MIPKAYIDEWRQHALWQDDYQDESSVSIISLINIK